MPSPINVRILNDDLPAAFRVGFLASNQMIKHPSAILTVKGYSLACLDASISLSRDSKIDTLHVTLALFEPPGPDFWATSNSMDVQCITSDGATISMGAVSIAMTPHVITVTGNVDFKGGYVKAKDHAIDDTHVHIDVMPGGGTSGVPR